MDGHACRGQIRFTDINGCTIMVFMPTCDGTYFGGSTHPQPGDFVPGSHYIVTLGGMLDLIGKIANADAPVDGAYGIDSSSSPPVRIRTEMRASDIAAVLGCDEQAVRDHFRDMISLADVPLKAGAER